MIIVRNHKLIKRSTLIGRYSSIIAILILAGGMYLSISQPEQLTYSLIALIAGFTLSQVGIFYSGKFSRSPRPDEELDAALKGFDDRYTLYHYQSPVSHLLVGPSGIWILVPYPMRGKIIYNEDRQRWKNVGSNLLAKFYGRDSLGKPNQDIDKGIKQLQNEFKKIPEFEIPEIKSVLVFTNQDAEVDAENAPIHTLHARQLKKLIRKEAKGDQTLAASVSKTIQDHLGVVSNE